MSNRLVAGFVPLVDCATLVAARENGFAAAEGLDLVLVKEPSWASLRDHLNLGYADCAHALAPLPIATALGVGHVRVDCFVPFVLSRGGNAITVSRPLFEKMYGADAPRGLDPPGVAAAALARAAARCRTPLTLGVVFPFSNHNFELRYWLASAGVHPDRDVRLVAIPPPLMVESLRLGHVDGFCVGEPWNSLAVAEGLGEIVAVQSQLFAHVPEKVLAVRGALSAQAERVDALLRSLAAAAAWIDEPENRPALAALLARPEYLGLPAAWIEALLRGDLLLGVGRSAHEPDFLRFHRHATNAPAPEDPVWIYAQMLRWGQLRRSAGDLDRAVRTFRADIYRRAIGRSVSDAPRIAAFDGVELDASDVGRYLERFALSTAFVEPSSAAL
jgi:ABC-type nitrate/sulfonate/bicarbonate transport system substrate-binding protein